jgi:Fic family protein
MQTRFNPVYKITAEITRQIERIEEIKKKIASFSLDDVLFDTLKKEVALRSAYASTKIEDNQLLFDQVRRILISGEHFPEYALDEREVKGYYAALSYIHNLAPEFTIITEKIIQRLHAYVMSAGEINEKTVPTAYREGQNVIEDEDTGAIIYQPPKAREVPILMTALLSWINKFSKELPIPIVAAISHYQLTTIHPYYDGSGLVARLLATLMLQMHNYNFRGLCELNSYYADDIPGYFHVLAVGRSPDYYDGRKEADITNWIVYFVTGMAASCEQALEDIKKLKK